MLLAKLAAVSLLLLLSIPIVPLLLCCSAFPVLPLAVDVVGKVALLSVDPPPVDDEPLLSVVVVVPPALDEPLLSVVVVVPPALDEPLLSVDPPVDDEPLLSVVVDSPVPERSLLLSVD